jgi:hypothetical protein
MQNDSFERDRACYDQNFQQMRALNDQMVKIPQVAVAITGGLWFAVGSVSGFDKQVAFILLSFGCVINFGLGASCLRIRDVMSSYLEKIESFSKDNFASGIPEKPKSVFLSDYSMIKIYIFLMCLAGFLSLVIAVEFYYPYVVVSGFECAMRWMIRAILYGLSIYSTWHMLLKKPK